MWHQGVNDSNRFKCLGPQTSQKNWLAPRVGVEISTIIVHGRVSFPSDIVQTGWMQKRLQAMVNAYCVTCVLLTVKICLKDMFEFCRNNSQLKVHLSAFSRAFNHGHQPWMEVIKLSWRWTCGQVSSVVVMISPLALLGLLTRVGLKLKHQSSFLSLETVVWQNMVHLLAWVSFKNMGDCQVLSLVLSQLYACLIPPPLILI